MSSAVRIALLGAWSGAMLAFAALAVPGAFGHLPTSLAAEVLGGGFVGLDRFGLLAGLACCALGLADRSAGGRANRLRALAPLLAVAGHALSLFWVTPGIAEIRELAGGSIGQLPAGDDAISRFASFHEASRGLYTGNALIALCVCLWDIARFRIEPPTKSAADGRSD